MLIVGVSAVQDFLCMNRERHVRYNASCHDRAVTGELFVAAAFMQNIKLRKYFPLTKKEEMTLSTLALTYLSTKPKIEENKVAIRQH